MGNVCGYWKGEVLHYPEFARLAGLWDYGQRRRLKRSYDTFQSFSSKWSNVPSFVQFFLDDAFELDLILGDRTFIWWHLNTFDRRKIYLKT